MVLVSDVLTKFNINFPDEYELPSDVLITKAVFAEFYCVLVWILKVFLLL